MDAIAALNFVFLFEVLDLPLPRTPTLAPFKVLLLIYP